MKFKNEADFVRVFSQFAPLVSRELTEELEAQGKGIMRTVLRITPPSSGLNMNISTARKQGVRRIESDMRRILAPVPLRGSRTITQLFGKPAEQFGGPWTVPTKENWPHVGKMYSRHTKLRSGKRLQYRKAKFYVDERKFRRETRRRGKAVGTLMAGAGRSALGFGLTVPAFAKRNLRHAPKLRHKPVHVTKRALILTTENTISHASDVDGLKRRMEWATRVQAGKMQRQIPFLIRKAARRGRMLS